MKVSGLSTIDARGRPCPWPILMLAKALRTQAEAELIADDPATLADLKVWCETTGATLLQHSLDGVVLTATVRAPAT